MAPWLQIAALPSTLLFFIFNSAVPVSPQHLQWPYDLSPEMKYYPEDEQLIKRDIDIQQKLQRTAVSGVRKMSSDPGEKFYLHYWAFSKEDERGDGHSTRNNATSWISYDQAIRVHDDTASPPLLARHKRLPGWNLFSKRDFQCPSGTNACTSIDRPNSCCGADSTCMILSNSYLGDVGCCPNGQTCGGTVSDCESGYTDCPNNPGGGCCLPGYACYEQGCIQTNTATVQPPPGPSTTTVTSYTTVTHSSPTSSSSTQPPSTTTSNPTTTPLPVPPPTQISTVTRTVTVTSSASVSNSLTCRSGYRSCPATLGGGCCPTDRQCGSANCPASTTSTSATAAPPVRPTTEVTTTTTTTTSSSTPSQTQIISGCPTGFYACSAYYQGGCCQTGRNCDTTSCPAVASTTLVNTGSLTIAAPTGSGITAPGSQLTGSCANGWSTCAPSLGGGCCLDGYACAVSTCRAPSGGSDVGKQAPQSGGAVRGFEDVFGSRWLGVGCGVVAGVVGVLGVVL